MQNTLLYRQYKSTKKLIRCREQYTIYVYNSSPAIGCRRHSVFGLYVCLYVHDNILKVCELTNRLWEFEKIHNYGWPT